MFCKLERIFFQRLHQHHYFPPIRVTILIITTFANLTSFPPQSLICRPVSAFFILRFIWTQVKAILLRPELTLCGVQDEEDGAGGETHR